VHEITTAAELRRAYGHPFQGAMDKEIDHLDRHCREFIALSPFVVVASAGGAGACDASPKGGLPGFVSVLDDHRLAIPDARGNRRLDSLHNLLENPQIGLLFMIPGMGETLRINGTVQLTREPELLTQLQSSDRPPTLAIVVRIEQAYLHCAKSIIRSGLWRREAWSDEQSLPSAAEILTAHSGIGTSESTAISLAQSYVDEL
jgi:PPOX class probable FMN-dependent enzyme